MQLVVLFGMLSTALTLVLAVLVYVMYCLWNQIGQLERTERYAVAAETDWNVDLEEYEDPAAYVRRTRVPEMAPLDEKPEVPPLLGIPPAEVEDDVPKHVVAESRQRRF